VSLGLLTAVDHRHEADLVESLEGVRDVSVVRRCADVPELVSVAAAGSADAAIVSATFRGIDREVIRSLAGHGVRTLGMCERHDESGERMLRQIGVAGVVHPDTPAAELVEALRGDAGAEMASVLMTGGPAGQGGAGGLASPGGKDATREAGAGGPATSTDAALRASSANSQPGVGGLGDSPAGSSWPAADRSGGVGVDEHIGERGTGGEEDPDEHRPGRVIAVWGPIGSPGRTTVAVTMASVLAARGTRVLLVDADTWGASVGQVLGLIDESPGLAAAARLSDQGALDLASLSRVAPEVSPGLRVVTGLPRADRWPEARASAVADLLAVARLLAEVVVVDCGFALEDDEELSYDTIAPRRNGATLAAIEAADEIVVVGAADPVGLQRLVRGVQELDSLAAAPRTLVVNKVRSSAGGPAPERAIREVLGRFSGLDDVAFLPWAGTECDLALWEGRSLVEVAHDSALTKAVRKLADKVSPDRAATTRVGLSARRRKVAT
jgi:MinD-like ATPase involved in chromosome partitioning or flagellar assembly